MKQFQVGENRILNTRGFTLSAIFPLMGLLANPVLWAHTQRNLVPGLLRTFLARFPKWRPICMMNLETTLALNLKATKKARKKRKLMKKTP